MGVRMMDLLTGSLDVLRFEPTAKRIRVNLAGEPVADTLDARLVWEPRRCRSTHIPARAPPSTWSPVTRRPARPPTDPTIPIWPCVRLL
jgi:hypothetical protein